MKRSSVNFDERTLLDSFKANDPEAFRSLYNIYNRQLFHYASRFITEQEQIEDIISESFVIIWQKRNEFDSLQSVAAYLYTVTRNACFTYLRKNKKRLSVLRDISFLIPRDNSADMLNAIKTDLIQFSIIAARELPQEMSKVFQLIYIEGFSAARAAEELGLSVHTIKAQKANAVRRIKHSLIKKGLLIFVLLGVYH